MNTQDITADQEFLSRVIKAFESIRDVLDYLIQKAVSEYNHNEVQNEKKYKERSKYDLDRAAEQGKLYIRMEKLPLLDTSWSERIEDNLGIGTYDRPWTDEERKEIELLVGAEEKAQKNRNK